MLHPGVGSDGDKQAANSLIVAPDPFIGSSGSPPIDSGNDASSPDVDNTSESSCVTMYSSAPSPLFLDPLMLQIRELADNETLISDYIFDVQGTHGVSMKGRHALLEWILEFSAFFGLSRFTYVVAAGLIDLFLNCTLVKPEHADLLGVSALYIASETWEPDLCPTLRELRLNCDDEFTERDISKMSKIVTNRLGNPRALSLPVYLLDEMVCLFEESYHVEHMKSIALKTMTAATLCYEALAYRPSVWALAIICEQCEKFVDASDTIAQICDALTIRPRDLENARRLLTRSLSQMAR